MAMAADAILLNHCFAMIGDSYWMLVESKGLLDYILGAVYTFPDQVVGFIVIGKMAIDAFQMSVQGRFLPGIMLVLHSMTGCTKFRS